MPPHPTPLLSLMALQPLRPGLAYVSILPSPGSFLSPPEATMISPDPSFIDYHVTFVIFSHVLALHSPGSSSHGLYISGLSTSLHSSQPGGSVSGFWAQSPGNHSGLAGRLEPQVKHSSSPGSHSQEPCHSCSHPLGRSAVHPGDRGEAVTNNTFNGLWTGKD